LLILAFTLKRKKEKRTVSLPYLFSFSVLFSFHSVSFSSRKPYVFSSLLFSSSLSCLSLSFYLRQRGRILLHEVLVSVTSTHTPMSSAKSLMYGRSYLRRENGKRSERAREREREKGREEGREGEREKKRKIEREQKEGRKRSCDSEEEKGRREEKKTNNNTLLFSSLSLTSSCTRCHLGQYQWRTRRPLSECDADAIA
jgi:hypothetical protein